MAREVVVATGVGGKHVTVCTRPARVAPATASLTAGVGGAGEVGVHTVIHLTVVPGVTLIAGAICRVVTRVARVAVTVPIDTVAVSLLVLAVAALTSFRAVTHSSHIVACSTTTVGVPTWVICALLILAVGASIAIITVAAEDPLSRRIHSCYTVSMVIT